MSAPKYSAGDKIFAKVRGYSPWPASIESVVDETSNKVKYHVYFYGTNDTAICKQEELCPYVENRAKYGKPMKNKKFNEALTQLDAELGLSPAVHPPQTPSKDTESELENRYVADKNSKKKSNVIANNAPITVKTKGVRRRTDGSDSEQPASKQRKKSSLACQDMGKDSQETTPSESRMVSKSGRKIKPKKFFDGSYYKKEEYITRRNKQGLNPPSHSEKSNQAVSKSQFQLDSEFFKDAFLKGTFGPFTPKGEEVRLKLNLKKPDSIKSENVKQEINETYQDWLIEIDTKMSYHDKKETLEVLKTQFRLLEIDEKIKSSLNIKPADPESALKYMDDFLKVNITPLMLKKNVELLNTVWRLKGYLGNTSGWEFSEEKAEAFASKAAEIRAKAEILYSKMKSLFMVPSTQSFGAFFNEELRVFKEAVKRMHIWKIYGLTKDPVKKPPIVEEEVQEESDNTTSNLRQETL